MVLGDLDPSDEIALEKRGSVRCKGMFWTFDYEQQYLRMHDDTLYARHVAGLRMGRAGNFRRQPSDFPMRERERRRSHGRYDWKLWI